MCLFLPQSENPYYCFLLHMKLLVAAVSDVLCEHQSSGRESQCYSQLKEKGNFLSLGFWGVFFGAPRSLPPFWYWQPQSWEMLITKKHASVSACKEECSVWRNSWKRTSGTKEASKPHVATQPSSITGKKREESVTAKTANSQSSSQQYERLRRSSEHKHADDAEWPALFSEIRSCASPGGVRCCGTLGHTEDSALLLKASPWHLVVFGA